MNVPDERPRIYTVETLTVCGRCPGWSHYGNPEEGQKAFREHRNQTHPAAADRGQRTRRRAAGQISKGWKEN